MNPKTKALLYIHIAVFLWGFTGILGKLIQFDALQLVWWRLLICSIFLLPFTVCKIITQYKQNKKQLFYAIAVGFILAMHWVCFYGSLKLSNISVSVVCLSATAFFSTLIEYFTHNKKITLKNLCTSIIAIIGIACMFKLETQYRMGILLGIIASILNAFIPVFNKAIIQDLKPLPTLALELFSGLMLLSILAFMYDFNFGIEIKIWQNNNLVYLLILSTVCTILPMYLAYDALLFIEPFTENIIINLEPVYTVVIAFVFFNEGALVGWGFYLGISLIFCSVILQTYADYKNKSH